MRYRTNDPNYSNDAVGDNIDHLYSTIVSNLQISSPKTISDLTDNDAIWNAAGHLKYVDGWNGPSNYTIIATACERMCEQGVLISHVDVSQVYGHQRTLYSYPFHASV